MGINQQRWEKPAVISDVSSSPDGRYLLISSINRPFSYAVPYYYFPSLTRIWDIKGNEIRTLFAAQLTEDIPRGYDVVLPGRRSFSWRADKPATVVWIEALDAGNYDTKMEVHDQVYLLDAPFNSDPAKLIGTGLRFRSITWGKENYAIITEGLEKTKMIMVSSFNPLDPQKSKRKLYEFNSDDRYGNPGTFLTTSNSSGRQVLLFADKGKSLFLSGTGGSPEGDRPFLDRYEIPSGKTIRMWRSESPYYESFYTHLDISKNVVMTIRQSVTEIPNYFIRDMKNRKLVRITNFENPYPQLSGLTKELVKYKRADGVDLSFTLYLPSGYDKVKDGPLPTLMWAYPREFN